MGESIFNPQVLRLDSCGRHDDFFFLFDGQCETHWMWLKFGPNIWLLNFWTDRRKCSHQRPHPRDSWEQLPRQKGRHRGGRVLRGVPQEARRPGQVNRLLSPKYTWRTAWSWLKKNFSGLGESCNQWTWLDKSVAVPREFLGCVGVHFLVHVYKILLTK